jgi:TPR repeat protein
LREAAAQGDANAEFTLGLAYRLGRGIAANEALALQWLHKAAAHGHAEAIQRVGGVSKETNVSNIISPVRVPPAAASAAPVPEKNPSKPAHDLQRIILGLFRKK